MFIGCDQQTPGADVGAVDHHIFGRDCDGREAWGDVPAPGGLVTERTAGEAIGFCLGEFSKEPREEALELVFACDVVAFTNRGGFAGWAEPSLGSCCCFSILYECGIA